MTPREVHIAIDLGLQKVGSFAYSNFKPQLIDYAFNRMGDAYITEHTTRRNNPQQAGLEDNISRLSNIRELITEISLPVYLISSKLNKEQETYIPVDFLSFVEAQGDVIFSCTNSDVVYTTSPANIYHAPVSFKISDFGTPPTPPFSQVKVFKIINTTPVEIFDFSDYSTGLSDIEEIFTVQNLIVQEINRTQSNLKAYIFPPDEIMFESIDDSFDTQGIRIAYTNLLSNTTTFIKAARTTPNEGNNNSDSKDSYCRLVSNEELYHLINHPFGTTSPESPIITIQGDRIAISINKRFILKTLTLKYIRKPRRMNLPLNQSYEIQDERVLAKIIDMTVEYLAATIESTGYQALTIENQQRD